MPSHFFLSQCDFQLDNLKVCKRNIVIYMYSLKPNIFLLHSYSVADIILVLLLLAICFLCNTEKTEKKNKYKQIIRIRIIALKIIRLETDCQFYGQKFHKNNGLPL